MTAHVERIRDLNMRLVTDGGEVEIVLGKLEGSLVQSLGGKSTSPIYGSGIVIHPAVPEIGWSAQLIRCRGQILIAILAKTIGRVQQIVRIDLIVDSAE